MAANNGTSGAPRFRHGFLLDAAASEQVALATHCLEKHHRQERNSDYFSLNSVQRNASFLVEDFKAVNFETSQNDHDMLHKRCVVAGKVIVSISDSLPGGPARLTVA